jgi:hypothetical protein
MQSNLKQYLNIVFSSTSKKKLKSNINSIAGDYSKMNKSIEAYISIGNLIIGIRSLYEWQEKIVEVIKYKLRKISTCTETYLLNLSARCEDKILFIYLGYGPLFDNLNFLKELMTVLKSSRNAFDYKEELNVDSYIVDNLKSRLDLHRSATDVAYFKQHKSTISEMTFYEFFLIKQVVFMSSFSKRFSSKLQTAIFNELHNHEPSEKTEAIELDNDILDCLKKMPFVKSFIDELTNLNFGEESFRNFLYPPLPEDKTEIGRRSSTDFSSQFASRLNFD